MADTSHVVALRSDDPDLLREVAHLTDLVGLGLQVVPPGGAPPKAALLLDGALGGVPWQQQPGGPPVVRVRHRGRGSSPLPGTGGAPPADVNPPATTTVQLPEDAGALLERVADRPVRARTVAVVGAHGGAGASVLAAAVARAAAGSGLATTLVDLDGTAGGIDLLLATEHDPGVRWADLQDEGGSFLPRLVDVLPVWCGVRVLSADRRTGPGPDQPVTARALRALGAAQDLLVLDVPRGSLVPGDTPPAALVGCDVVLLVSGTTTRAAAGAVGVATLLRRFGLATRLVVRRAGAAGPDAAELAERCQVPLGAAVRPERFLGSSLERGLAPGDQARGPLLAAARRLVRDLDLAP